MTSSSPIVIPSSSPPPLITASRRIKSPSASPYPPRVRINVLQPSTPPRALNPSRRAPSRSAPVSAIGLMALASVRRDRREPSPEWGAPIHSPSLYMDEAEEHDSPPHDSDSDSDLTSLEGDDCREDEDASQDGSIHLSDQEFEKDDAQPSSTPVYEAEDEEEEAVLTQTTATDDGVDARREAIRLSRKPDGAWVPPNEEEGVILTDLDDDESDCQSPRDDDRVETDDESDNEDAQELLDIMLADFPPEDGDDLPALNPADDEMDDDFFLQDDDSEVDDVEPEALSHSAAGAAGLALPAHSPSRVVCTWTHYDCSDVPLEPWTHNSDERSSPSRRGLACRRFDDGEVQVKHPSGLWMPSWRVSLRRPALPPTCDGCEPQM